MTSPKPNYFPKAPSPNTITLGFGASTYTFWRDITSGYWWLEVRGQERGRKRGLRKFQSGECAH